MEEDRRKRKASTSLNEYFDLTVFNEIAASKVARGQEELAADYEIFTERIKFFDESDTIVNEDLCTKQAAASIRVCADISEDLRKTNEEETGLLTGLEELIENLLYRLETIHHVRNDVDVEELVSDEDEYDEEHAQTEITALFEDCTTYKSAVQKNIISCNATLGKLKMEISELVNSHPRTRRMSRNMGMLKFVTERGSLMPGIAQNLRKYLQTSAVPQVEVEVEEFNPQKDVAPYVEEILKFIKEQELPDEEANPVITKVHVLSKILEHFKGDLKEANKKSTEDQLKVNNLQNRLPKLEESRVRLSQQCETLRDEVREKDTTIAKLKMKIGTMETIGNKNMEDPKKEKETSQEKSSAKQAIIPKAVLKDVLQASDKEVEDVSAKLGKLASANEAVRVVLVRKNKQIRQLEGSILQLNAELKTHKEKISELQDAIVAGTADIEAIKEQQVTGVKTPDAEVEEEPSPSPLTESVSPSTDADQLSTALGDTDTCSPDSLLKDVTVITIDGATNTEIEMEDGYTQTDVQDGSDSRDVVPDLDQISFKLNKKRRKSRKASIAMVAETSIRRASVMRSSFDARRRSSMAQADIFGIASAAHRMTPHDLATIGEFDRSNTLNKETVKQVEDIAVLQKYIASMREQSQKSMEKVREFIAKEKQRNEATTRKLINEHEKVVTGHKKEMNKVYYAIHRFREMVMEVLNGKDLTQMEIQPKFNFKYEQSPLQLRIQCAEMLSSMEFEIYQALKVKDMKIRDLSGRKRLDDRDLDRRIKEREKTVFSLLDHTNKRLRKDKERVNMREQWVNNKIKTELQYEKHQESEVQTIEKALVRFWREHGDSVPVPLVDARPILQPPYTTPRSEDGTPPPEHEPRQKELQSAAHRASVEEIGFEAVVPKLYISVSNQRENIANLDVAHRGGLISNLAHKLITNIIVRYLELTEQKIQSIFKAYIKYRRYTTLQMELMNDEGGDSMTDMNRAMVLHRKLRDALDLQYKKLHVELGKLSKYCGEMLEEEDNFFSTLPDHRVTKNIVRPAMLHINHNAMLKKIMQAVPETRDLHVMFPNVSEEKEGTARALPANLEEIPVLKQVANNKPSGNWNTELDVDIPAKSLLIPRLLQLDTDKMIPVRLQKHPTQSRNRAAGLVQKYASGLPPIPLYSTMKSQRFSYLPTICSVWSNKRDNNYPSMTEPQDSHEQ